MDRDLKDRTKLFAIKVWKLCAAFPKLREYNAYVNQLIRSSSSFGANYRASQRAKSRADFINKLKIVEEEIDESMYFLELLMETSLEKRPDIKCSIPKQMKFWRLLFLPSKLREKMENEQEMLSLPPSNLKLCTSI
ncbi:four helix bundle protein [Flagellimonas ochracea]|uniref:four helix bundle protein n=1 Tax=Flagellimonas ochracea TaxID=2696472 RepID=UPI001F30A65A|nr:four helix bundle protein [Allomuricauda ochracea]